MHELSIGRAVLDGASRHAGGRRVVLVSVSIGALRQVVPDSLAFDFEILSRGTICDGARLEIAFVRARLGCSCGREWEPAEPAFRCPRCGSGQVIVLAGDQLSIDSIEVEEVQCTAPR